MPHIHTEPDQHDMTVSAYIVRRHDDQWLCLVHYHKKIDKLMQIGGHVELNETPWQAMAHELSEESGYALDELEIVQPTPDQPREAGNVTHPVPFSVNTHNTGNDHYHSDACFGFVAQDVPRGAIGENEAADLRWLTIDQLQQCVDDGEALQDAALYLRFPAPTH